MSLQLFTTRFSTILRHASTWRTFTQLVLGLTLAIAAGAHAYVGWFMRYMADDYCMATTLQARGFWEAQRYWYDYWTGSVAFNFVATVAAWLPPDVVRLWPAFALAAWIVALAWAIHGLRPASRWWTNLLCAGFVVLATLDSVPFRAQSFYWLNGALRYLAPQIVFSAALGFIGSAMRAAPLGPRAWLGWLITAALTFSAGTISEVHMAAQTCLLGLALFGLLGTSADHQRQLRPWLLAALAGALCASVVTLLAPGTINRQSFFRSAPGLSEFLLTWFGFCERFLRETVQRFPLQLLATFGLACVFGWWPSEPANFSALIARRATAWLIGLPLATLAVIAASLTPAAWALGFYPPLRVLLVPQFALISGLAVWGVVIGQLLRRSEAAAVVPVVRVAMLLVACGGVLYPLTSAWRTVQLIPSVSAHALAWDHFDRELRAGREQSLGAMTLPAPENIAGLETVGSDPQHWVNACVSAFYGVAVTGYPPPPVMLADNTPKLEPLNTDVGGAARVLGYRLTPSILHAGETMTMTVWWQPERTTDRPYTIFVHLYEPTLGSLAQHDAYPVEDRYLTTQWIPGRDFLDTYTLQIPSDAPRTDQARLVLGLYDAETLQRLPVEGPDAGEPGQAWVEVGTVVIR
ncbi:MAG: DUF6056 family protein [Anaerolineales bacterium]